MRVSAAAISNKGRVRQNNEDNLLFGNFILERTKRNDGCRISVDSTSEVQRYIVCDGMGGVDAGEEASYCAVYRLRHLLRNIDPVLRADVFCDCVQKVSDTVYNEARERGGQSGTTMVVLAVSGEFARVFHVGDSRAYALRSGKFSRLTSDHSEVQRLINMGVITQEESHTHPKRHVISQYLGMSPQEVKLSVSTTDLMRLQVGDWFLLCSDGLTDMLSDDRIQSILSSSSDPVAAADTLVASALAAGGHDNVTVICVKIQSDIVPDDKPSTFRDWLSAAITATCIFGAASLLFLIEILLRIL